MTTDRWRGLRLALTGIRPRILVWYITLFALSLVVAIVGMRQILFTQLENQVEAALAQEAEELALLSGGTNPRTGEPFGDNVQAIARTFLATGVPDLREAFYFMVDGEPFRSTSSAPADLLADPGLVAGWAELPEPIWGESLTDAGETRWLAVPITSRQEQIGTFVVARFVEEETREINQAVRVMALVSGGVLVLASVLGLLTTSAAIAPIRTLTRGARRISDQQLSERIPVQSNDEVGELTETFNDMLDRLEASFTTQRQFLDDIGHELRTPITILQGHLELLPDDPAERAETLALCLDELDRMSRYVLDLSLLARSGQPDFLRPGPVELDDLTRGMLARGQALAPEREWHIESLAPLVIEADGERLTQAWLNLVSNAVQHTDPGDPIHLGSLVMNGHALLWVRDEGPGVPAAEQGRIFERFQRGVDTRSKRPEGTGLGLAIVGAVARAHGGRVELDSQEGQGATFRLVVPVTPLEDDDTEDDTWPES